MNARLYTYYLPIKIIIVYTRYTRDILIGHIM